MSKYSPDPRYSAAPGSMLSSTISSALVLAALVGVLQLLLFTLGANAILNVYGISNSNAMHSSALSYTRARALGTPFYTLWLVMNNVFRGLGDSRSPLIGALIFIVVSIVTDHIFLQVFDLGIVGSAFANAAAQVIALLPLFWILQKKVPIQLRVEFSSFVKYISTYGKASVYLLGRSLARTAACSYSSRRAVRLLAMNVAS